MNEIMMPLPSFLPLPRHGAAVRVRYSAENVQAAAADMQGVSTLDGEGSTCTWLFVAIFCACALLLYGGRQQKCILLSNGR